MKIIHIADTHLGRSAFNKTTDDGSNLRETLIYENFLSAIVKIIIAKPDVLVHAGDLFDAVRPKTKAYTTVLTALDLLKDAGIPLVIIAGNHSMQKTMYNISPFEVITRSNMISAAYSYKYEKVEVGDTFFHLIPNMLRVEDYHKAYKEIQIGAKHNNVLVTHGLATTIKDKKLSTVAEFELDENILTNQFDYIALGHYHGQMQVALNAWYSGSIEYLTYGEIADVKGGLEIDPNTRSVKHFDLPCSLMQDIGIINCEGGNEVDIIEEIDSRIGVDGRGDTMIQVTLDFGNESIRSLSMETLSEFCTECNLLDLKIRVKSKETLQTPMQQQDFHAINYVQEFSTFLQQQPINEIQKPEIEQRGIETLKMVIAQHSEVKE